MELKEKDIDQLVKRCKSQQILSGGMCKYRDGGCNDDIGFCDWCYEKARERK